MKIIITQYEREDGVVLLRCREPRDKWILRTILGPAWFWNPVEDRWIISLKLDDYTQFCLSEKDGLELLKTVIRKT